MKQKQQEPRIVRTQLRVPYKTRQLAAIFPILGPDNYQNLATEILRRKQLVPTGDYIASLIHPAYCDSRIKDESESLRLRKIINEDYFYVYNTNLWTSEGVYVLQDQNAIGLSQMLDQNTLEKMLRGGKEINGIRFSKNKQLRFAPKGSYKILEEYSHSSNYNTKSIHTPESLSKDGFVIASFGLEGAKKLGEVSSTFKNNPVVLGFEIEKVTGFDLEEGIKVKQCVSALNAFFNESHNKIFINGDYSRDCGREGFAFGMCLE